MIDVICYFINIQQDKSEEDMSTPIQQPPNCYKCRFRGNVPRDTHSCCNHTVNGSSFMEKVLFMKLSARKLNIQANPHGVKKGWFFWPLNFDPAWLVNCDGFEAIKEKEDELSQAKNISKQGLPELS